MSNRDSFYMKSYLCHINIYEKRISRFPWKEQSTFVATYFLYIQKCICVSDKTNKEFGLSSRGATSGKRKILHCNFEWNAKRKIAPSDRRICFVFPSKVEEDALVRNIFVFEHRVFVVWKSARVFEFERDKSYWKDQRTFR